MFGEIYSLSYSQNGNELLNVNMKIVEAVKYECCVGSLY